MRRLVLKMSMTLDGYVGGPAGEIDWILRTIDAESTSWTEETLWQAGAQSRATTTPVVVQEFVAGERASDVWPALDEAQRCDLAGEFGAVVGRLFGAQP